MTLSDISIKNPVFAWMLMFGLILFGFISFRKMGLSQMPDVDFPVVNISVNLNGAAPEIMETNVVDIIEESVMSVEGIVSLTSTSKYGSANITVEFDLNQDVDAALQDIQTKVIQAQKLLPKELDPPVVTKYNPEEQPIMWVGVSYTGNKRDLMVYIKDHLKNKFSTVPGVGQIMLGGYTDRNLRLWVDGKKLSQRELTIDDILSTIQKEHVEVPAGLLETKTQQMNIRSMGEALSVTMFGNLPISFRGGTPIFDSNIRIKDIALLEDGLDDVMRVSRFNGKQAVGMGIIKQRGVNAVKVAEDVKKQIELVKKDLPPGFEIGVNSDSTRFIKESIEELEFTLILSAILTSLVTWFFLGSLSSTINILLAIPTSIMGSFIILNAFGFTLNTFTLLGLSLAIGIVVDDAIMVLENIVRHREMGKSLLTAAIDGAREITFAAIAATLAIVAIFLPVAFMSGIIGKYFYQFAITITAAVLLSLLEALTLTPMRCSQFLQTRSENRFMKMVDAGMSKMEVWYEAILKFCLSHKLIVLSISAIIFGASIFIIKPIKKEFVPSQDQSQLLIRLQTPVGSSFSYTDTMAAKCEEYLLANKDILRVYANIGGGGSNSVMFFITLKSPQERTLNPETKRRYTQNEISVLFRKELGKISKELKIVVQDLSMRGFSSSRGFPVEFYIQGKSWEKLAESSDEIIKQMKESGKFVDVDTNYQVGQPELHIVPNREAAMRYGVSISSIGTVIGAMIGGVKSGQFTEGGHRYYVNLRVAAREREKIEDIKDLYVRNNKGELVRVSDVVKIEETKSLQSITRMSRERAITIFANPAPGASQEIALKKAEEIARKVLPEGYSVGFSGSAKTMGDSFNSLGYALLLGIVIAYMILASQFNSYIHPVTVLLALPFSFTGAVFSLWITGNSLNVYSFIALILLMGLVKKNSIILVDFTNQLRDSGLAVKDALLKAGPVRLRPILMTSISTIAAAIPPALSIGPGGETRVPMAIAIIGGIVVSTLLTLVVVPCAYMVFARGEHLKTATETQRRGE
ncbi:MAG: efflux RND transporter permease subunit [Leptospiraceae bacterium]|nr:efflux RND transporter permease subunit [Leptospiraceae bacterium]